MSFSPVRSIRPFRSCGMILLFVILGCSALRAELPVRVAVIGEPSAVQPIEKRLTGIDGVTLIVTEAIAEAQKEFPVGPTEASRRALGQALRVHLIILANPDGLSFAYVDGQTGEELFRIRQETTTELAEAAYVLVKELRDSTQQSTPPPDGGSPKRQTTNGSPLS